MYYDINIYRRNVKDSYIDLLQITLITVIGAYFGGRSLEKRKR